MSRVDLRDLRHAAEAAIDAIAEIEELRDRVEELEAELVERDGTIADLQVQIEDAERERDHTP